MEKKYKLRKLENILDKNIYVREGKILDCVYVETLTKKGKLKDSKCYIFNKENRPFGFETQDETYKVFKAYCEKDGKMFFKINKTDIVVMPMDDYLDSYEGEYQT